MKNKRKWKSLNRRGLAALLTLAMCLGTVPFTAFAAEDTHEHNQNGWNCEWVEPEQELNCQHEHDEDCYVPGEPVLECTEDHHEEDCYVPGEDVLTCENEDEDHEHDEDCYASGEAVLECDEDHHTEDCYAPGEPVLDCRHEHGEDCFSAAEGFWSCTPPVEDAADEADKDVVEDEDQFDNDGNQGAIVEDETFEDDDQTDVEDEGVFNDDEQQNDVEDEDEALIPDEVQAFLDAVAAIPEITPENAEEVAEYVYGEVSECYEALLGTEYEEREDVQEAAEVYAAAVEAVDAALDMDSENYYDKWANWDGNITFGEGSPYSWADELERPNMNAITKLIGEDGLYAFRAIQPKFCPYCYYHFGDSLGKQYLIYGFGYENDNPTEVIGDNVDIAENPVIVGGHQAPAITFNAQKPGTEEIWVQFFVNFHARWNSSSAACPKCRNTVTTRPDDNWYLYTDYFTVTVQARYALNYDGNATDAKNVPSATTTDTTATSTTLKVTTAEPTRTGYKFLGWAESSEATKPQYTGGESIGLTWTEDFGSADNPVSKTLYAVWEEDNSAPEAPTYGQVGSILGRNGFVRVKCDSESVDPGDENQHTKGEEKTFSTIGNNENNAVMDIGEVEKREDGYYCTLTLHGSAYAKFYGYERESGGTGVAHTLKPTEAYPADQTITLKWNPDKQIANDNLAYTRWEEANGENKGTILATFLVVCKAPETLYTVTYTDGVKGEIVFDDQGYEELKAGAPTPHFKVEGKDAEPTREGYTFMGWAPAVKDTVDSDMADEDGVITYTATWQKKSLSKFTKELVKTATEAPANVTDITYPDSDGKVIVPADGTSITLLYKITVTGDVGAKYTVTDEGAKWAGGAGMVGTIPEGGEAVIYVTKSFTKSDIKDGHLYNVAKVVPGTGTDTNATTSESTPAEVEQKQEYTLKYDANGGEGAPSEMKQENATFTISNTKPERADFVFAGWADEANATKAQYQPGNEITLTKPEQTLYAVWAGISVMKTMEKTKGSVDDDKLRNGDTVLYTVAVKNTGKTPLNTLQFFDDMDLKLTKPTKITIDSGWDVTSTYYPADASNKLPLLHIYATGNTLGVGESVVVQYEAKIDGADGTKVINTVNVYAEIGEYVSAASRKMAAFRSNGPGGGASSEGETVKPGGADVGDGTGGRPTPPTTGVTGDATTGGDGEGTVKPPVVDPNPALSVTKTADKKTASVGETITYTVTVTNTGDVALTGVTVKDTMAGKVTFVGEDSFESFDLDVGETKTIKYTYVVTTDDAGKTITNDVSVTSDEVTTSVQDRVTVMVKPVEPENVTITIEYVNENGEPIGGTYAEEVEKGSGYDVSGDIKAPDGYAIISITGDSTSGTADSDKTITVTCGEDKRGNDNGNPTDEPDGIPDVFQPIVTYIVTGGTWQENGSTEKEVVFNLVDEQGNPVTPTLNGTIPTPVVNAATNTEDGAGWTGTAPAADTEVTKDGATYRYEFPALEGMRIITVNRVHNGNTIVSIPVTVPDGEAYTVTDADAPAAFDNGGNHYIRIDATLPTVPAGDEDVSVDVRYALDNIGGGTNGNSPDGIPDGQQAVVYYRSSNTAYGTVRDAYQMFDLRPDIASREETLRNAATVVGRARFTNWTMGSQALSTSATLENAFTVEAGHTYTVTANFTGYTGGGSSGGGGGGGGGGGSSSGNTSNNNNTNNDTTTNDDTVTINDAEVPLADLTSLNREDHFAYVSGYTDGTVRPTNNITREEVAAIFYRLLTDVSRTVYETGVNNFSDVDSSRWSNNAISTLANAGIISGYKEGTFKPGQTITRAEFAAIASRFDSVSENVTNPSPIPRGTGQNN